MSSSRSRSGQNFPFDWPASVSHILSVRGLAEPKIVGRKFTSRIRPVTALLPSHLAKLRDRDIVTTVTALLPSHLAKRHCNQACAQMRPGTFKCKCKCKRRIKCKCKCKCSASESNANANANAQQLNQMQMHLNQMQMHLNQMRINLYQMQTVFYKCVFCVQ